MIRTALLTAIPAVPVGRTAAAGAQHATPSPRDTTPVSVVREYVAAFDAKELDAI